jgi:hypothetical protein
MRAFPAIMLLVLAASAGGAAAADPEQGQAKCRKAEINPVTGHVFCFDPLGAPVEPIPSEAKPACKPEDARGQWTYAPNCTPEPGEM